MSNDDEVRDTDPTGRYIRFDDELGRGAYKVVYRAIDRDRGIEVAWNQIRVDQQADFEKLWKEITILQSLSHPNILVCHAAWVDEKQLHVAFITECMTSGTIRQFMKKAKVVKLKVIKGWCTQILEGLAYLHTRQPPIIHRDIKCDNILINGTNGIVKIGDLGLATNILNYTGTKLSIIGTPEFMAPEYYEEVYDEKVDIWAFGMCLLEMATLEYPFSECTNPAQIFKKVSAGHKPRSLMKLKDADILQFLEECLAPAAQRKSAAELLQHPFLQNLDDDRILGLRTDEEVDELLRGGGAINNVSATPAIPIGLTSSTTAPMSPSDARRSHHGGIINGNAGAANLSNQPPIHERVRGASGAGIPGVLNVVTYPVSSSPPPMPSAPIAIPGRKEITNHMEYTTSSLTKPPRSEVSTMSSSIGDSDQDRGNSLDSPPMSMTSALADPHATQMHHSHTGHVAHSAHSPMISSPSASSMHHHASSSTTATNTNNTSNTGHSHTQHNPHHSQHNQIIPGQIQAGVAAPLSIPINSPTSTRASAHLSSVGTMDPTVIPTILASPPHQSLQPPSYPAPPEPPIVHYGSPPVAYPTMVPPVHLGPGQGDMIITVLNTPQSNLDPMIVSLQLAFGATGTVEFDFRIDTDTALSVAREMSDEFHLSPSLLTIIAQYISDKVGEYVAIIHPSLGVTQTPALDIPLSQQRSDPNLLLPPTGSPRHGTGTSPRRFVSNMNLDKHLLSQLVGSRELPIPGTSPQVASPPIAVANTHVNINGVVAPPMGHPTVLSSSPGSAGHMNFMPNPSIQQLQQRSYRMSAPLDNELENFEDPSIHSPRRHQNALKRSFSTAADVGASASTVDQSPNMTGGNVVPISPPNLFGTPRGPNGAPVHVAVGGFSETRQQPQELGFSVGEWGSMATDPISRAVRNRSASAVPPRRPTATAIPTPDFYGQHIHPNPPSVVHERPFDDSSLGTLHDQHFTREHHLIPTGSPNRPASMALQLDHRSPHFGSILHEISADMHNNSRNFENALRDFEHPLNGQAPNAAGSIPSVGGMVIPNNSVGLVPSNLSPIDPTDDTHPFRRHHDAFEYDDEDEDYEDDHEHHPPPSIAHRSSPIAVAPTSSGSPFSSSPLSASVDRVMSMSTPFGDVMITTPAHGSSPLASPTNRGSLTLSSNQLFSDQPFSSN
jgi:serine/threonine protein kinase